MAPKIDTAIIFGFKGFDKDFKCRDFQYEIGKNYKHDGALSLCHSGFHFCEHPLDVLGFYGLRDGNRYAQVEGSGVSDEKERDSKRVSSDLHIKAELTIKALIDCAVKFTMDRTKSATSGDSAHSATSGCSAHSATSGCSAHSATSGDYAHSSAVGKNSIACALGRNSTAKAAVGNWIVLTEYASDGAIRWVKTAKVDGKEIKADTFYKLQAGKFVEVRP